MKRFILVVVSTLLLGTLGGCSNKAQDAKGNEPDLVQIKSICNLATVECYYHNVAKSVKTAGDKLSNLGEKDRTFWIEYTGVAKVGIDMSKVSMEIDGENVTITMPSAELLSISIDEASLNEDSYTSSADGINSNKITAEDQTSAIDDAQKTMEENVKNNASLLLNAQNRAEELIENYIKQLGEISDVDYKIKWVYEEDSASEVEE